MKVYAYCVRSKRYPPYPIKFRVDGRALKE